MEKKDVEPEPDGATGNGQPPAAPPQQLVQETDDFGLPMRKYATPVVETKTDEEGKEADKHTEATDIAAQAQANGETKAQESHNKDAEVSDASHPKISEAAVVNGVDGDTPASPSPKAELETPAKPSEVDEPTTPKPQLDSDVKTPTITEPPRDDPPSKDDATTPVPPAEEFKQPEKKRGHAQQQSIASIASMQSSTGGHEGGLSEFSHQQLSTQPEPEKPDADEGWQTMPAYARYDMYDDDDRLIAKEYDDQLEDENHGYGNLGGAGKGYTRVQMDEDAQSANSMDDNTKYLFKESGKSTALAEEDDDDTRDALSQMQATKDLLTEGQRIAYVGVVRLEIASIVKDAEELEQMRSIKKLVNMSTESTKMWGQKMMIRVYAHMDISEQEQVMIEQLAEHGVIPADLVPALHANARVNNPMAGHDDEADDVAEEPKSPGGNEKGGKEGEDEEQPSSKSQDEKSDPASPKSEEADLPEYSPMPTGEQNDDEKKPESPAAREEPKPTKAVSFEEEEAAEPPPPYEANQNDEVPEVQTPSQMPSTEKIDIDLRWTVLCDLFLLLIADSVYDARSRVLLERVAQSLDISWTDICRFEKRVTDALEMQQAADKENWNEDEHMESRRKRALRKRYMMLGLATVGGGLVIGLSAGLLAPMIGAGLAAGFTTIGVGGTSGFLGGIGGAAMITSGAAATGSVIGGRAAHRRTGAVRTFEYRPLHNNKRVNLIVTVSGWLTGNVDDVRLPYSTVDSTMGDIYSVLWEPEMLRSIGDTIKILATEALTQSIQQVLGGTILAALMGALQLPLILTKLSYLIDNPWAVSLDRATAAGKILADSLIERNLGTRPITLVGYSLGSRVIFSCLQELAKRGAYGLIQNVYIFGSPVVYKKEEYLRARTVVPGRFVNGYNRTDWVLGYLFRLTSGGIRRVAGLGAIEGLPWIENMDCTEFVNGHMEYRTAMPTLLIQAGWMVESDEFTEIEDPDPENHTARQRELINEIEEARKKLEEEGKEGKGGKSKFSIFGRKKKMERQEWELYEETTKEAPEVEKTAEEDDKDAAYRGALFDVDAIRAELAKDAEQGPMEEEFQIREIKSTLPPMRLDISNTPPSASSTPTAASNPYASTPTAISNPYGSLRETRSADHVPINYTPEDEISMTFDTAFDDHHNNNTKNAPSPPKTDDYSSTRPDLKSSQTVPNVTLSNPWGDPDDEDFGKEKEISMTFA